MGFRVWGVGCRLRVAGLEVGVDDVRKRVSVDVLAFLNLEPLAYIGGGQTLSQVQPLL